MASAELDRTSGVPLYRQIRDILRAEIDNGQANAAEPMTEAKLIERFGVSLAPIRQALQELAREGVIVRQQGRGTFPAGSRVERPANLRTGDLYRYLKDQGLHPASRVTGIERVAPPEAVSSKLSLEPGERCLHFTRLISVDDQPFAENDIYIRSPDDFLPATDELKDGGSALDLLASRYGVSVDHAEHEAWAASASPELAKSLDVILGTPVLVIDTVFVSRDGKSVGWRRAVHLPEEFKYRFISNA